jgi:ABC-type bacteriocin/lantibiotic exporter with double-glycine peptidase domain
MQQLLLHNISFRFTEKQVWFFDHLSATFDAGMLHLITGKNGVGKSTLFTLVQGTIEPPQYAQGVITCNNISYDISKAPQRIALSTAIHKVAQDPRYMTISTFTVADNLAMARIGRIPSCKTLSHHPHALELLKTFGINQSHDVAALSGGQRQILAIGMALQQQCSVLLLDEPTAALDDTNTRIVVECLHAVVASGIIVLCITHDPQIIEYYPGAHMHHQLTIQEGGIRTFTKN